MISNISSFNLSKIPDIDRFIPAIKRTLSGESATEGSGPLTEDQITLRKLNRELGTLFGVPSFYGEPQIIKGQIMSENAIITLSGNRAERDEAVGNAKRNMLRELLDALEAQGIFVNNGDGNNSGGIDITG